MRKGASHQRRPSAISSPGVVTKHRLAAWREQKARVAAVTASLTDLAGAGEKVRGRGMGRGKGRSKGMGRGRGRGKGRMV